MRGIKCASSLATVNPRQRASAARSRFPPSQGSCEGTAASALARQWREHREPFHARGARRATWRGKAVGVAGRWRTRDAATRDGKANGAGGFARQRERGEGEAVAGRGAVRAKRGGDAADFARSATPANGVSADTHRPLNALAAGRLARLPTAARSGRTRSARVGAAPQRCAACARPAWGRRWRWRVPERSEGRGAT